jgi:hypothetical protein
MTVASLPKRLRTAGVTLCLVLVAAAGATVPAQGAPATGLRLHPATGQVTSGETFTLALWVDDVEDLHRVELHLDYDWAGLEVQDADPRRVGVQIEPGPVFCASCTPWNEAISGSIHFVAQREAGDGSFSGSGIAATITFQVTATEPDTYTVSFDRTASRLLDPAGTSITVDQFTDAALVLSAPLATLTGWLTREGMGGDGRSVVNAVLYPSAPPYEPSSWGRTCTDANGDFTLVIGHNSQPIPDDILPADSPPSSSSCAARWAFVRLDFTNYLSECYWECTDGDVRDIGWHDLEGGDVNGDGCINILDIVQIIGDYGATVEEPCHIPCAECPPASPSSNVAPSCDLNEDCQVNILDLSQAVGNFGLCSNCP